jgi:hypothetical protein
MRMSDYDHRVLRRLSRLRSNSIQTNKTHTQTFIDKRIGERPKRK